MSYIKDPKGIENKSFEMITEELAALKGEVSFSSTVHEAIIKRAIHTSADFDYYDNLQFTHDVVEGLKRAMQDGCTLYTDTQMAAAGINKPALERRGCKVVCLVSDERVAERAKREGTTRSMAAVDFAVEEPGNKIFVIGNAPTALFRIMELYPQHADRIKGVVAVPVGFVGAAESKQAIYESSIPAISALGRKGGSNVAAAIINAILYAID